MKSSILLAAAAPLLIAASLMAETPARMDLERSISRTLQQLPGQSVFDAIQFRVGDYNQVVLDGAVTNPAVKESAEKALQQLAGVGMVVDHLKVKAFPQEMMK